MKELSTHYREMLKERQIKHEWTETTLKNPAIIEQKDDGTIHYVKQIPENDGRWLRVVVNESIKPNKIITAFFDRRLRRKKHEDKG